MVRTFCLLSCFVASAMPPVLVLHTLYRRQSVPHFLLCVASSDRFSIVKLSLPCLDLICSVLLCLPYRPSTCLRSSRSLLLTKPAMLGVTIQMPAVMRCLANTQKGLSQVSVPQPNVPQWMQAQAMPVAPPRSRRQNSRHGSVTTVLALRTKPHHE